MFMLWMGAIASARTAPVTLPDMQMQAFAGSAADDPWWHSLMKLSVWRDGRQAESQHGSAGCNAEAAKHALHSMTPQRWLVAMVADGPYVFLSQRKSPRLSTGAAR